jgi:G protein-coupled receptor kinase interactor 2
MVLMCNCKFFFCFVRLSFDFGFLFCTTFSNPCSRGSTSPSGQPVETNGAGDNNETEPVTDNQSNTSTASTATGAANKRPVSMYEARQLPKDDNAQPSITKSLYTMSSSSSGHSHLTSLPLQEEVKKRTEVVTRRIQELWAAMQDIGIGKKDAFIPCSERIRVACAELTAIFPQVLSDETLKNALKLLNLNTNLIQRDCTALQHALLADDGVLVETHLQEVRHCAYNLAMATKTLVTHFQTV